MWVYVGVGVGVGVGVYVCVCMYVYVYVYIIHSHTHTHTHVYTHVYAVMLILIFSGEAMILFGDRVPGFDSYGLSIIQCIFMALGTSSRGGARRQGGGAGTPQMANYNSLSASSEMAPLFYFPFIFLITFVVFNITVAIIGDSYSEIKKRQDPEGPNFEGAPSEQRTGKTVTLWHQMKRGVHRRLTSMRMKSEDPYALSKERILKMCHNLKSRNARAKAKADTEAQHAAKAKLEKADAEAQHAEAALVSAAHGDASVQSGEKPPAQAELAHNLKTGTDDLVDEERLRLVDLECLTYPEFVKELKHVHQQGAHTYTHTHTLSQTHGATHKLTDSR